MEVLLGVALGAALVAGGVVIGRFLNRPFYMPPITVDEFKLRGLDRGSEEEKQPGFRERVEEAAARRIEAMFEPRPRQRDKKGAPDEAGAAEPLEPQPSHFGRADLDL